MLTFYDKRSASNKRIYRVLSVYVIFASTLMLPLFAFGPPDLGWRILGTLVSASVVTSTSLLAHLKAHENWLSYRAYWDALKREESFFDAGIRDYSKEEKNLVFVERVESIVAREGAEFYARHERTDQSAKDDAKKIKGGKG